MLCVILVPIPLNLHKSMSSIFKSQKHEGVNKVPVVEPIASNNPSRLLFHDISLRFKSVASGNNKSIDNSTQGSSSSSKSTVNTTTVTTKL